MRGRSSNTMKSPIRAKHRRRISKFTADLKLTSPARKLRTGLGLHAILRPRGSARRRYFFEFGRLNSGDKMQNNAGKKKEKCKNCEGKGTLKKGDKVVRCQRCDGTGIKRRLHTAFAGLLRCASFGSNWMLSRLAAE